MGMKPRIPSTSTSTPPLIVLVTLASTIAPFFKLSQLASIASPLRRRWTMPSLRSKWSTTTSMSVPGCGDLALEMVERNDPLALAAEINEEAPASDADDPSHARPLPAFLPPVPLGHGVRVPDAWRGGRDVERLGVEAAHRRLKFRVQVRVPLTLERKLRGRIGLRRARQCVIQRLIDRRIAKTER